MGRLRWQLRPTGGFFSCCPSGGGEKIDLASKQQKSFPIQAPNPMEMISDATVPFTVWSGANVRRKSGR